LIGAGESFSDTTKPTRVEVNRLLDKGYSIINTRLTQQGYSTPLSGTETVFDEIVDLESLYAAAMAQMGRMSSRLGPQERTKGQVLLELFNKRLDALLDGDLSLAGLTPVSARRGYVGGISRSEKKTYTSDTDRVAPRFTRDQFRHEGSQAPAGGLVTDAESGGKWQYHAERNYQYNGGENK